MNEQKPDYEFFRRGIANADNLRGWLDSIRDGVIIGLVITTGFCLWFGHELIAILPILLIPGWGWARYIKCPEGRHRHVLRSEDSA